jgi:hypothetical protein
MRFRVSALLFAVCFWAVAAGGVPVDSVVATVRTSLHKKRKDAELASTLAKITVAERLDDRVIEILESEGTGPQALGALQHLRDITQSLPEPAAPPAGMTPPPPPSAEDEHRVWTATREKALVYTQSLPDFVCTETIRRWSDPNGHEAWHATPTVTADLRFFDKKEHYQLIAVDGRASNKSLFDVGGTISEGEFGSLLGMIFTPASETDYRWDHWTVLRKRPTFVFFYRIAASHRPHHLAYQSDDQALVSADVAQRGFVYIDQETNAVTRIVEEADEIPADFPVRKARGVIDYDYADIAGARFLLPVRAEIRMDAGQAQTLNSVEFAHYRKFGAASDIKYGRLEP